jgi:chromate reductase
MRTRITHHTPDPNSGDWESGTTIDSRECQVGGTHDQLQGRLLCRQSRDGVDQPPARQGAGAPRSTGAPDDGDSFKDLSLYSYDYDANYPPSATAFKNAIAAVDAVLFVTPEYNRSIPGALKNAIDWASRPYGTNAFARKPSAIIGTSPGKIGTAVAQQHLRSILSFCNSPQMNSLEAYIHFEPGLVTEDGQVTNLSTEEFLRNYMAEFHAFITRVYTVLPRTTS